MRKISIVGLWFAAAFCVHFVAWAQSPQPLPYAALTQSQWEAMDRDLHYFVSMPEPAHQNIHSIMQNYQREAQILAAQAKAMENAELQKLRQKVTSLQSDLVSEKARADAAEQKLNHQTLEQP